MRQWRGLTDGPGAQQAGDAYLVQTQLQTTVYDRIACRELATQFQGRAAVILPATQVNRPRGTIDFHVSKR